MPTFKPRVQLTLAQHQHDLLKRLAELQGVSMASLVLDIIEPAFPVLERVCVVLEAAQRAQESSKEGMRSAMAKAEAELMPHLIDAVDQFDLFVGDVGASLGADLEGMPESSSVIRKAMGDENPRSPMLGRRRGATPPELREARLDPPLVTRGSGRTRQVPSNPTQAAQIPSRTRVSKK